MPPKPRVEDALLVAKQEKKQKLQQALDEFKAGLAAIKAATSRAAMQEGVDRLTTAIALRPNVFRYYSVRGNAYRALGQHQRAFFDYSAAARIAPTNALNYCNRAIALRKLKRYSEALADLSRASELESNPVFNFNRGLVLFDMGSYDGAATEFSAAIATDTLAYKAYFNRANCYRRLGRVALAVADLRVAVGADASQATGHNSLGLALCEMGQYEEALGSLNAAVDKAPGNPTYLSNRAVARYNIGQLEEAIQDLNLALQHGGDDSTVYFHRGNTLLEAGKPEDAIEDLKKAYAVFVREITVDVASESGAAAAAALFARPHSPSRERRPSVGSRLAGFASPEGGEDAHRRPSVKSSSRKPSTSTTLSAAGRVGKALPPAVEGDGDDEGEEGEAPAPAEAAVEATLEDKGAYAPSDEKTLLGEDDDAIKSRILHSLGLAYQAAKMYEDALAKFNEAFALNDASLASQYRAGLMYYALGRYAEGHANFSAVITDCDEPRVREARGLCSQSLGDHRGAVEDFTAAVGMAEAPTPTTAENAESLGFTAKKSITPAALGETYYHRAVSFIELGSASEALSDVTSALAKRYTVADVHDAAARAHTLLQRLDTAVTDYDAALAAAPSDPGLLCKRAQTLHKLGRYEDAEKDLSAALRRKPGDPILLYLRGLALYELDRFEASILDLKQATRSDPPPEIVADCHYHVGLAYANSDQHLNAVMAYNLALQRQSSKPLIMRYTHERAKALQLVERFDEAIADFDKVIADNPRNAHALFRRAFAYKSLKKYDKAAADFEQARVVDPDNPTLIVNYSRLHEIECIILCAAGEEPY